MRNEQSAEADLRDRKLPVLVTGASAGIGSDLARVFARNGHDVALVARRGDRLEALREELARDTAVRVVVVELDLATTGAVDMLSRSLERSGFSPGILVNNAGIGLAKTFSDQKPADQLALIDLNIRALTELTARFLQQIVAARGAVMQVASVAGFYPGPGMAVYYASKAYVVSLSKALAYELRGNGVTVSVLCPGPTKTEFFDRAGIGTDAQARMVRMEAMAVAEAGYRGLMAGRKVIVPGALNKFLMAISKVSPHALSMPIIARMQMNRRN